MNRPHVPDPSQADRVLQTAVADLAARHGALLHDPLAMLEILTALTTRARQVQAELVADARTNGHTWTQIADALGVSPHHARTHHNREEPRTA